MKTMFGRQEALAEVTDRAAQLTAAVVRALLLLTVAVASLALVVLVVPHG